MPPFTVFLFSLFIFLHRVTSSNPAKKELEVTEKERAALLSFYSNIVEKDPHFFWNESEHHCSWRGVTCDPSLTTVIGLRLPAFGLVGEIPLGTIGNLSNLLYLSLPLNRLSGKIPFDFFDLVLSKLLLSDNSFTGGLENINTVDLKKLDVSHNAFTCSVPTTLHKFPKSAFTENENLCGYPLPSCNWKTYVCREPYKPRKAARNKRVTIALLLAVLGLILVILLSCLMKIYQRSKQSRKPTSAAMEGEGNNKLLWFDVGMNSFDCHELLKGSAKVLGKGSAGTSYRRELEENKTVVLKRLKDVVVPKTDFESHMKVLGTIKNENVVPLKAYYYSEDEKWLVNDYMDAGSLSDHLHENLDSHILTNLLLRGPIL